MGATYRKIETGCDLEKLWIDASERKNTRTIQYPVTSLREKEPDKIARVDKGLYMYTRINAAEEMVADRNSSTGMGPTNFSDASQFIS